MIHFLLLLSLALIAGAAWGFSRNRTALRNVVVLLLGIGAAIVWIALVTDSQRAMTWLTLLFIVPVVLSMPVLVIALLANGLVMVRRESRSLKNLLSLIVGLIIVFMVWSMARIFGGWDINLFLGWGWISAAMVLGYFAVAFVVYLLASWLYSAVPTREVPEYGIVLGARLIDGEVPPLLRSRLDRSIQLYHDLEAQSRRLVLVPTGGQGKDEIKPEGVGMAEYLVSQGIPESDIVVEDKAVNTRENLLLSRDLMGDNAGKAAIITNNYHVFRAALLARKIGLKAHVYGARTKFYYLPSAVIREFLAIMVQYKWLNVLVVLVLLAISGAGLMESLSTT